MGPSGPMTSKVNNAVASKEIVPMGASVEPPSVVNRRIGSCDIPSVIIVATMLQQYFIL
jgi:hypothetical protein